MVAPNLHQPLILHPGSRDAITGHRSHWAERLLAGRAPGSAAVLLPNLYTLCAQAHRLCAALAAEAASNRQVSLSAARARKLMEETAREHVRCIWLDWPRRLSVQAHEARMALADLTDCPMLHLRPRARPTVRGWIERSVLGGKADIWRARWRADPAAWLDEWCVASSVWPARALVACRAAAQARVADRPLYVHGDVSEMQRLARQAAADEAFASHPVWNGLPSETGCWARLRAEVPAERLDTAWLRLGARVAELAVFACTLADSAPVALEYGAVPTGDNEALAWCEMSRGLLLHWLRLHDTTAGVVIGNYRVIAPTEWNFHPGGAFATYLGGMTPEAADLESIDALAAAYDPCVAYFVESGAMSHEAVHHA